MDIVYILGTETAWENNELRYSLRSLAANLSGISSIIIVGSKPDFVKFDDIEITPWSLKDASEDKLYPKIIYAKHRDDLNLTKERRIMEKVSYTCQIPWISSDFFFMNDDMFLLNPLQASELPNYYKGTLINSAAKRRHDRYYNALMNTSNALAKAGHTTNNFDTHSPIIYNKQKFIEVMNQYDWTNNSSAVKYGYVVKSLYANTLALPGEFKPDCKIDQPMTVPRIFDRIQDRPFFSIGDNGLNESMKQVLNELYPNKSPWEI